MTAVLVSAVMYAFNLVLQRMQALIARRWKLLSSKCDCVSAIGRCALCRNLPANAAQWGGAALAAAFAVTSLILMSLAYRQPKRSDWLPSNTRLLSGPPCSVGGFLPRR